MRISTASWMFWPLSGAKLAEGAVDRHDAQGRMQFSAELDRDGAAEAIADDRDFEASTMACCANTSNPLRERARISADSCCRHR